ncbi:STY4534 family ICE replication protein [Salinisphaera orenii]|uniref:STY4534 family ICE replication protein n=1 Tax=Salinisphaera orenii TaxID=856731 RepID=UPI000DBE3F72
MSSDYFDLHTEGIGYLNRVRKVDPKRGQAFWACDIAAIHGAADDVATTRFDCRVSGAAAIELVQHHQTDVDADRKVLIGFRLGDLWVDTFTYKQGDRAGETGVALKARLLYIRFIKVDGQRVYTADRDASDTAIDRSEDEITGSTRQTEA